MSHKDLRSWIHAPYTPERTWGAIIIDSLLRNGVERFICAAGTCSNLLGTLISHRGGADLSVHYDERGVGFRALGYGRATGRPAVVITTGGTAVANLAPAVAEADAGGVPLILLTGDWTPGHRQASARQRMEGQDRMFMPWARAVIDLERPSFEVNPATLASSVDSAVRHATGNSPGPVHINFPFKVSIPGAVTETAVNAAALEKYLEPMSLRQDDAPFHAFRPGKLVPETSSVEEFSELCRHARGVIFASEFGSGEAVDQIVALGEHLGWPVFPQTGSGLRADSVHGTVVIRWYAMLPTRLPWWRDVEVALVLGRRPLGAIRGSVATVVVASSCDRVLPLVPQTVITASPSEFCRAVIPSAPRRADREWLHQWQELDQGLGAIVDSELTDLRGDLGATCNAVRGLPENTAVFIASSAPFYHYQALAAPSRDHHEVGANRGLNGIDGTIASAIGYSEGLRQPTVCVLGDLAFLHDVSSLPMARECSTPIVFIVLNNNGFGAIQMGVEDDGLEIPTEFLLQHGMSFRGVVEDFGLQYHATTQASDLCSVRDDWLSAGVSGVIEVRTDVRVSAEERHKILSIAKGRWVRKPSESRWRLKKTR
jgi:2-succinyl-5-enolpyruvyl-6-hydroxy-3-cyclohexene-1-carboxylate synthase